MCSPVFCLNFTVTFCLSSALLCILLSTWFLDCFSWPSPVFICNSSLLSNHFPHGFFVRMWQQTGLGLVNSTDQSNRLLHHKHPFLARGGTSEPLIVLPSGYQGMWRAGSSQTSSGRQNRVDEWEGLSRGGLSVSPLLLFCYFLPNPSLSFYLNVPPSLPLSLFLLVIPPPPPYPILHLGHL